MNDSILVIAGIVAAKKWNIDPTKVNVMLVGGLESFKVKQSLLVTIEDPPKETTPRPPSDDMIFEQYNGAQWRSNDFEFWLAWGPITNTLAIHIKEVVIKSGHRSYRPLVFGINVDQTIDA